MIECLLNYSLIYIYIGILDNNFFIFIVKNMIKVIEAKLVLIFLIDFD